MEECMSVIVLFDNAIQPTDFDPLHMKKEAYMYDPNKTMDQHIGEICYVFNAPGLGQNYILSLLIPKAGKVSKPVKFDKKKIKPGIQILLTLDFKLIKENPLLLDIYTTIMNMESSVDKQFTKLAFDLIEKLKDQTYCDEFRRQNGVQELIKKMKNATGNDLGYILQALDVYIKTLGNFQFLKIGLLEQLLESLFSTKLTVCRRAASILATLSAPNMNQGASIFMRKRSLSLNWGKIISLLDHTDIQLQTAVFEWINNVISLQTDKELLIGKFQRTLQRQGILKGLIKHFETEDFAMRKQLHIYQVHHLSWLFREKQIPFDEQNEEHVSLLKRLWKIGFPNEEFGGIDHENWKLLGFQYRQPQKDLRAAGLLGLRHLIFLAETYTHVFTRRKTEFQDSLQNSTADYQLPMCTMGINISNLLFRDIFPLRNISFTENEIGSMDVFPMILHPNGLLNMYCIIFEYTYCLWYREKYTYLRFMDLLNNVKDDVITILNSYVNVVVDIETMKSLILEGTDSELQVITPSWDEILIKGDGEEIFDYSTLTESAVPRARLVSDIIREEPQKKKKKMNLHRLSQRVTGGLGDSLNKRKKGKKQKTPRKTSARLASIDETTSPSKAKSPRGNVDIKPVPFNPDGLKIDTNLDTGYYFTIEEANESDNITNISTIPSMQVRSLVSANKKTEPMILQPTGTQTAAPSTHQSLTLDYSLLEPIIPTSTPQTAKPSRQSSISLGFSFLPIDDEDE